MAWPMQINDYVWAAIQKHMVGHLSEFRWLADWLAKWLAGCLAGRLAGLACWLGSWLGGWLACWLTDWHKWLACCPWGCRAWLLLGALRGTNISTYSARRVLPSTADVLLSSTDRASLGTWAGSTAASLARPTPLRLAMPLRYSAVRSSVPLSSEATF